MWIPELNRELAGRNLAIWLGQNPDGTPFTDLSAEKCEAYRRLWREQARRHPGSVRPQPTQTRGPKAPGCCYLGPGLTGFEREARGLDHRRNWHACAHPGHPLGDVVCACRGCGPRCPGYQPGPAEHDPTAEAAET